MPSLEEQLTIEQIRSQALKEVNERLISKIYWLALGCAILGLCSFSTLFTIIFVGLTA